MPAHGNLSITAAKLNISDMYKHFQSEKSMHVKLPKFKLQYKQDLRQALTSMGKIKKKEKKKRKVYIYISFDFWL